MQTDKIAFIGCGNMGRSLIGGLIAAAYPADLIIGVDPAAAQQHACQDFRIKLLSEADASISACSAIVLAVKPQILADTLQQLTRQLNGQTPLLISIAAGVRIQEIAKPFAADTAIVRVMPNTPSLLQLGAAGMYANPVVTQQQRALTELIMQSVGIALWLDDEDQIDVVTAVSGSGPAYFFLFIELLEKIAEELGLDAATAKALTAQTALGAASMVHNGKVSPAALRQQVTSAGGTTEQALNVMMDGRLEHVLHEGLKAAWQRSIELSRQPG